MCAVSIIQIIGTIIVMSQVAWEVFVVFVPTIAACIWYQVSNFTFVDFRFFFSFLLCLGVLMKPICDYGSNITHRQPENLLGYLGYNKLQSSISLQSP